MAFMNIFPVNSVYMCTIAAKSSSECLCTMSTVSISTVKMNSRLLHNVDVCCTLIYKIDCRGD